MPVSPLSPLGSAGERVRRKLEQIRERNLAPQELSADVLERSEAYTVIFDAPGVAHEDLQVRFVDGRVMIRGERFRDAYEGFELVASGRSLSFQGEVPLPEDAIVTPESGAATLRSDGTLAIEIPKDDGTLDEGAASRVPE